MGVALWHVPRQVRTRGRQQRLIQLAEGGGRRRAGSGAASAGRPRPAAGASISAPASGLLADVTAGPVLELRVSQLGCRVSRKGELATQAEWVGKPEEHRCRRRASRGNTRGASRLGSALAGDRPVSRAWLPALLSAPCTVHQPFNRPPRLSVVQDEHGPEVSVRPGPCAENAVTRADVRVLRSHDQRGRKGQPSCSKFRKGDLTVAVRPSGVLRSHEPWSLHLPSLNSQLSGPK